MTPIPTASLRPDRRFGLMIPLAVMAGLVVLLLLPNLVMLLIGGTLLYLGLVALPGGEGSQSAAAAVESPPTMR